MNAKPGWAATDVLAQVKGVKRATDSVGTTERLMLEDAHALQGGGEHVAKQVSPFVL